MYFFYSLVRLSTDLKPTKRASWITNSIIRFPYFSPWKFKLTYWRSSKQYWWFVVKELKYLCNLGRRYSTLHVFYTYALFIFDIDRCFKSALSDGLLKKGGVSILQYRLFVSFTRLSVVCSLSLQWFLWFSVHLFL